MKMELKVAMCITTYTQLILIMYIVSISLSTSMLGTHLNRSVIISCVIIYT